MSIEELFDFFKKSNFFIKAKKKRNRKGEPLVALREKYTKQSHISIKFLNALSNKIQ